MKSSQKNERSLLVAANHIRRHILDICYQSHSGHIGPALSVADILTVLYFDTLRISVQNISSPTRDRFILSKGHAASALYSALYEKGIISRKKLLSYCKEGGHFGTHPEYNPKLGLELTTGSLGHGLSVGVGMALGLRKIARPDSIGARVFVLVSDAELNEGSIWEAVMFAGHHKLENLIVIVDDNGQQAFGKTKDVINLRPIEDKWKAFGWGVKTIDGHDVLAMSKTFKRMPLTKGKPSVVIARTIAGKGVSFMEGKIAWHYVPLDQKLYQKALYEINIH